MLDLNAFKQINDSFGHMAGDDALRHVASVLRATLRTIDFPARWAGDEFGLILPGHDHVAAERVAARIRQGVARHAPFPLTMAVGIATSREASHPESLFRLADARLYEDKRADILRA